MSEEDDERVREEIREKLRDKQQEFVGKEDKPKDEDEEGERPAGPPGMKTG